MPPSPQYSQVTYPLALDYFFEASDGQTDENRVHAAYINKVQDALSAIQTRAQHTPSGAITEGTVMYVATLRHEFRGKKTGVGSTLHEVEIPLDPAVIREYFSNDPFHARYALFVSAVGYQPQRRGGQITRNYHRVVSSVRIERRNNQQVKVGCLKTNTDWARGDVLEVTLTLVRR